MTEAHSQSNLPEETSTPREQGGFPVLMLILLVLVTVLGWGCYVWATGEGDFDFRRFAFLGQEQIKIYAAQGQVFFNGEPLTDGHVEAHPVNRENVPDRIIGPLKSDGTFEFYTDFNGTLSEGLPEGEYKLLLIVYHPTRPLETPSPILPDQYYDFAQTPLTIKVTADPQQNNFVFEETGELQPRGGSSGGGSRRGSRESTPDETPGSPDEAQPTPAETEPADGESQPEIDSNDPAETEPEPTVEEKN